VTRIKNRVRPCLESLDDRLVPSFGIENPTTIGSVHGVLTITPPAAQASPHTVQISHQVSQVPLPSGKVLPGHGLKTAEAHNPVVDWTPT
jgi:hypothetical protein